MKASNYSDLLYNSTYTNTNLYLLVAELNEKCPKSKRQESKGEIKPTGQPRRLVTDPEHLSNLFN